MNLAPSPCPFVFLLEFIFLGKMSPYPFGTCSILALLLALSGNRPGNRSFFRLGHASLPPFPHPTGQLLVSLKSFLDVFLTCSKHPYSTSRPLCFSLSLSLGLMSKKYFCLASSPGLFSLIPATHCL